MSIAGQENDTRRAELMAAARSVFGDMGYHRASMDAIARRAGLSKPVLYQHFPGKRALYLVIIEQATDETVHAVRGAVEASCVRASLGDQGWIRASMQCYIDLVSAPGGVEQLLSGIDARECPEVAEVLARGTADCIDAISGAVVRETSLPVVHARMLAAGLVGLATSTARHVLQVGKPSREDAVALSSQLAARGIGSYPHMDIDQAEAARRESVIDAGRSAHDVDLLAYVLAELTFPAKRWEVLTIAERYGASHSTLQMLHGLHGFCFNDLTEIVRDLRSGDTHRGHPVPR